MSLSDIDYIIDIDADVPDCLLILPMPDIGSCLANYLVEVLLKNNPDIIIPLLTRKRQENDSIY